MDSRASNGHILCYEDGKVIFEEDSIGKDVYIIESGKVEITKRINGRNVTIRILGKGDLFGENVMFANVPRPVTATAIGRTLLIPLTMEELIYRMQNNLHFAIELIQSLVTRLHNTDSTLKLLLSRVYGFSEGLFQDLMDEQYITYTDIKDLNRSISNVLRMKRRGFKPLDESRKVAIEIERLFFNSGPGSGVIQE